MLVSSSRRAATIVDDIHQWFEGFSYSMRDEHARRDQRLGQIRRRQGGTEERHIVV